MAFGNVIIVGDELLDLQSDYLNMKQSSFTDTMAYINSELDKAIELLPDTQPEKGRINKYVALAQKAEMLLYAASPKYNGGSYNQTLLQEAKATNDLILNSGNYSLLPNFGDATRLMDGNTEMVFGRFLTSNEVIDRDNTSNRDLAPGSVGGFTTYTPTQTLVDQFEVIINDTSTVIPATWSNNVRTVTTNPAYSDSDMYSNRDPRFYETVYYNGAMRNPDHTIATYVGGGDDRACTGCQWWNNGFFGYYVAKKVGERHLNVFPDPPHNDDLTTYHRLGGIMLNQAEILFQLGDVSGALSNVNQIRTRAGMPLRTSIDMDMIKHETVVELIGEGKRFNNLRRWSDIENYNKNGEWGMKHIKNADGSFTSTVISITTPSWDDKYYWIPIPQAEMNKNPNLIQAPGY